MATGKELENCLISLFYIKPQHAAETPAEAENCLISLFYIKPQRPDRVRFPLPIVLYLYSTSNHNLAVSWTPRKPLSYISILHQTTTTSWALVRGLHCLISLFYIKPQRASCTTLRALYCLISLFYIKPQRVDEVPVHVEIVLYLYSTSNHNLQCQNETRELLSYISILHQTTTFFVSGWLLDYCLISLFYIKPQRSWWN